VKQSDRILVFANDSGAKGNATIVFENVNNDIDKKRIATDLMLSEVVFIEIVGKTLQLDYFTPTGRIDNCGHATIGAIFYALKSSLVFDKVINLCGESIDYFLDDDKIFISFNKSEYISDVKMDQSFIKYLNKSNIKIDDVIHLPKIYESGLADIIYGVNSLYALQNITLDHLSTVELSKQNNVIGVHVFYYDIYSSKIFCRNFAPIVGINEEFATGTSNVSLFKYLEDMELVGTYIDVLQGTNFASGKIAVKKVNNKIFVGGKVVEEKL
jgi:PhzF family phenazine biosynthesis protein